MKERLNTIPNWLTLFRVLLIPVFAVFFLGSLSTGRFWSAVVFLIASFTDFLDGQIARKTGQVTEFGIWFDQFADKLLVWTALGLFLFQPGLAIHWIGPVLIVVRDLAMLWMRDFVKRRTGSSMKTSFWGKAKSAVQMVSIVVILALLSLRDFGLTAADPFFVWKIPAWLVGLSAGLAVVSWIVYILDNRGVLKAGFAGKR
jgi:CDP-diacylglycerol--glycerol-3-phosphate 3-phosphatidyltransferase